jgi:predicted DNA-binding transcriptional regulator YafY
VAQQADPALGTAARDLIAKIAQAVPAHLRPFVEHPASEAGPRITEAVELIDMPRLRSWIRDGKKLHVRYRDERGRESERTLWPVVIGYVGGGQTIRILAAWCESRQAFRHFRMDRLVALTFLEERFAGRPAELRSRWRRAFEAEHGRSP